MNWWGAVAIFGVGLLVGFFAGTGLAVRFIKTLLLRVGREIEKQ